jgi:hypothetical protein
MTLLDLANKGGTMRAQASKYKKGVVITTDGTKIWINLPHAHLRIVVLGQLRSLATTPYENGSC